MIDWTDTSIPKVLLSFAIGYTIGQTVFFILKCRVISKISTMQFSDTGISITRGRRGITKYTNEFIRFKRTTTSVIMETVSCCFTDVENPTYNELVLFMLGFQGTPEQEDFEYIFKYRLEQNLLKRYWMVVKDAWNYKEL